MESKLEEQNPTHGDEGASTLDRLERFLAPQDAPDQNNQDESQDDPDAGADSDVTTDGDGQQSAEPQLSTSDLAKLLKLDDGALDLDEEGNAVFKTKVDGVEGVAKLQDLLKSYQLQEHVDKKSREAAERERALQTRTQEAEQQFTERLQHAEALTNIAAKQLMQEYQSINWDDLKQQDPGRAALMLQEFQGRQAELRGVFQNIEQNKANLQQKSAQQHRDMLQKEAERLPQVIPEWKDQATASKEQREIREWAMKQGFQAQELDSVAMASHVAVMRKAMLFDKLQSAKPAIENKVRLAPKLVKPGQPAQNSKETELRNLKQAVRKSGGKHGSVAAYLLATGKV
jgi:hypothetical protein